VNRTLLKYMKNSILALQSTPTRRAPASRPGAGSGRSANSRSEPPIAAPYRSGRSRVAAADQCLP
jgi:hypothetical protein